MDIEIFQLHFLSRLSRFVYFYLHLFVNYTNMLSDFVTEENEAFRLNLVPQKAFILYFFLLFIYFFEPCIWMENKSSCFLYHWGKANWDLFLLTDLHSGYVSIERRKEQRMGNVVIQFSISFMNSTVY